MENSYSVYQHVTPDGLYYFGQTQNVEKRWRGNGSFYKGTALQPYIEKFGWDNIKHILLFREQTKENALWIEDFLIQTSREDGVCINKNRSGNVSKEDGYKQDYDKEYYEKNKDNIKEQKKQYYERNKEKFKEYQEQNKDKLKEYREENKDKKRNYDKGYKKQNKDKYREYQRQYYQRKKLEKQLKEAETTLF